MGANGTAGSATTCGRAGYRLAFFFLAVTAILAGCGEDSGIVSRKTMDSLASFAGGHVPQAAWRVTEVSLGKQNRVVVDVLIPEEDVFFVHARPRIQQLRLVEEMCPHADDPIWKGIPKSRGIWINLNTKSETVTGSSCPR